MSNVRDRMEDWFGKSAETIFNHRWKTICIMFLLMGALFSQLPKSSIDISTEGFLHKDDQTIIDYNEFRDQFGRDELVLVAVQTDDVFEKKFLKKLKTLYEDLSENVPYIEDINSLINARNTRGEKDELIVEDLLEKWPETSDAIKEVKQRALENSIYQNLIISPDSRFTTIILQTQTYSSMGQGTEVMEGFEDDPGESDSAADVEKSKQYLTDEENSQVVNAVRTIAKKYDAPDFRVYIAGSSVVTHFLKQSMMKDMRKFVALAVITVALFLFIMFRKISGVILPLLIVILSLLSTLSFMAMFGVPIKLPTQILPSFILAVSVGYSVHILAIFYQRFRKSPDKKDAIAYSISHSGLAILMTAATTAGGLFSFSTSEVAPIADLGKFAGAGVLLAMIYTIILLPALLSITPIKDKGNTVTKKITMDRILSWVGRVSTRYPYKILFLSAIIIFFSIWGVMRINFSHDPLRWMPEDNFARAATEKVDRELRGSITLEAIVDTKKENGLYEPITLKQLEKTGAYLETLELEEIYVGKAWSLTTILKETHRALNENREEFYTIPDDKALIAQELLLFENSGSDDMEDFTDSQFSKARLMIKAPFQDAITYVAFIDQVEGYLKNMFPDSEVSVTGMISLLTRVFTNAIQSMKKSYIYALIVITILMILLIGRLRMGLLSMIPNLTPIIMVLGIMGWLNIPMNLFTMLVGNIAIGLAVDDTIHFMHNFRRYYEKSHDVGFAVMETLHTAGRAMLVTSCVLSIGFFIFMFADMNNLFHFGLLTGFTIIFALLADYFLAPALMTVVHRNGLKKEAWA